MRAQHQRETEILRVSEASILPPKKCVRGAGSRGAGPRECGCGGGSGSGRRRRPQTPAATQIVAQKGGGDVTPIRGASIMTECVAHLQPTRLDACNVTVGCMKASIKRGPRARKPNAEGVRQTHVLPENEPLPQFMSELPKPTSTSIHLLLLFTSRSMPRPSPPSVLCKPCSRWGRLHPAVASENLHPPAGHGLARAVRHRTGEAEQVRAGETLCHRDRPAPPRPLASMRRGRRSPPSSPDQVSVGLGLG